MDELKEVLLTWGNICRDIPYDMRYMKDEYLNDIDVRDILEHNITGLDECMKAELADSDALFISKTFSLSECIWGLEVEKKHSYNPQKNWYYYRLPKGREHWIN